MHKKSSKYVPTQSVFVKHLIQKSDVTNVSSTHFPSKQKFVTGIL